MLVGVVFKPSDLRLLGIGGRIRVQAPTENDDTGDVSIVKHHILETLKWSES